MRFHFISTSFFSYKCRARQRLFLRWRWLFFPLHPYIHIYSLLFCSSFRTIRQGIEVCRLKENGWIFLYIFSYFIFLCPLQNELLFTNGLSFGTESLRKSAFPMILSIRSSTPKLGRENRRSVQTILFVATGELTTIYYSNYIPYKSLTLISPAPNHENRSYKKGQKILIFPQKHQQ